MEERLKAYNKFEHYLACGQFKKSINMALDKLMYPSTAFYQRKTQPALDKGLSRIEHSVYCNTYEEYQEKILNQSMCINRIENTLKALNQLKHKFYYNVSLELMLNSYFTFCKTQLVAFDANIQAIAYSYNKRSSTFVGVINNKTRHSPSNLVFLKKYLTVGGSAPVIFQGRVMGNVSKTGAEMELPIHSLNQKHFQKLVEIKQEQLYFNLANTRGIEITTGAKAVADFLGIKVTKLGYVPDGDDEDMYNEREVEVENVPEAMADEVSVN